MGQIGGGDFNTPGSVEYQHLHSDGGGGSKVRFPSDRIPIDFLDSFCDFINIPGRIYVPKRD